MADSDISVELIPLVERGETLPSVNEVDREEEVWAIVRRLQRKLRGYE